MAILSIRKENDLRTYETVFLLKPTITAEEQAKHIDFYKENIKSFGGEIVKEELWGKLQLSYKIETFTEAIYTLIQFKVENDYVNAELDKRFKFNEDVIRHVVVMLDEKKFKAAPKKEAVRKPRPEGSRFPGRNDGEEGVANSIEPVETDIPETSVEKDANVVSSETAAPVTTVNTDVNETTAPEVTVDKDVVV